MRDDAHRPLVLLMAGSPSDLDLVLDCQETLDALEIASSIRVLSAHRTPDQTADAVRGAEKDGFRVVIAFAGLSAALAGTCAAHTLLPVIAVPVATGALSGLDALLSSAQMPPGTPVATVALDGARNGALLAARILAGSDPALRERLGARTESDRARYDPDAIEAEIERRKRERASGSP